MKRSTNHIGTVYGVLAFTLLLAAVGGYKAFTTHNYRLPTSVASKSDVRAAAGQQNLVYLCESSITQSINSNGGQVKGYSHPTQKADGRKVKVSVTVGSDIYSGRLTCEFRKSNWQLGQVKPAA